MSRYFNGETDIKQKKEHIMKKNGSRIKEIRKSTGMTQSQLVDFLELKGGKSMESLVENGKKPIPSCVLPIIAEMGNTTVETFYSDAPVINMGNVFQKCLSAMSYSNEDAGPILKYMDTMANKAIENMGGNRLFDFMFAVLRIASQDSNYKGKIMDEICIIENTEYINKDSRYKGYLREMIAKQMREDKS